MMPFNHFISIKHTLYQNKRSSAFTIIIRTMKSGKDGIGHANKVLDSLAKHQPKDVPTLSSISQSKPISSTYNPKIDEQLPSIPEVNRFSQLEKEGVIQYSKTGNTQLTPEALDIHRSFQQKVKLNENNQDSVEKDKTLASTMDLDSYNESQNQLIGGTLEVNQANTELLEASQSHLVVGIEDPRTNEIDVFAFLTSEKGTKTFNIIKEPTTVKLTDNQPISGENKGQYVKSISPSLRVNKADFVEHEETTEFVNTPDIQEKLLDIRKETEKYQPIPYNSTGITMSDLEDIEDTIAKTNEEVD